MSRKNYQDTKAAVRAYTAGLTEAQTTTGILIALAGQQGVNIAGEKYRRYADVAGAKFAGQVTRALNQLADEGVLAKEVKARPGYIRQDAYWLPAGVAARRNAEAARARAAREAADAEAAAAWAGISDRLHQYAGVALDRERRLDIDGWERVLELLEQADPDVIGYVR